MSSPLTSLLRDMMRILHVHLYPILYLTFSFVLLAHPSTPLQPQVVQRAPDPELHQSSANLTGSSKRTCSGVVVCRPGIMLPVWLPLNPPVGEQAGRAIVYFSCLMYMFLGVSILADRFMASIEVITSQVRSIFVFTENKITILLFTFILGKLKYKFTRYCGLIIPVSRNNSSPFPKKLHFQYINPNINLFADVIWKESR